MKLLALLLLFAVLCSTQTQAQSTERIQRTWKGPDISAIWELLREGEQRPTQKPQDRNNPLRFTPSADSGVVRALADAFGSSAEQRESLVEAFTQIKQGYEVEVVKEGKSNNLAVAMAFFITANVVTYHQAELPPDADTDKLFESLQRAMVKIPAFANLSNAEKQQLHDWLVIMGGFALTTYMGGKQNRDMEGLATIKDFADYSMRLVLGVEIAKLRLDGGRLSIAAAPASAPTTVSSQIVGTWTFASSARYGGVMRLRYIFNGDGTYSFKSERSAQSQKWWTIEENGSFSVNNDSVTITPKTSRATLRNLDGVVQETRSNGLEKVTYKWTTHYFEGIRETNLVLQPPSATSRDGILGGNSLFPNAYLYSQGDRLEWRF